MSSTGLDDWIGGGMLLGVAVFLTVRNPRRAVWLALGASTRWAFYATGAVVVYLIADTARKGDLSEVGEHLFELVQVAAFTWAFAFVACYLVLLGIGWRSQSRLRRASDKHPSSTVSEWRARGYGILLTGCAGVALVSALVVHGMSGATGPISDSLLFGAVAVTAILYVIAARFYQPPGE